MKKCLAVVLTAALLLCAAPLAGFTAVNWSALDLGGLFPSAHAAEIVDSGTCGEVDEEKGLDGSQMIWTLNSDGLLTISGTGEMRKYYTVEDIPWFMHSDIKTVVIKNGVTSIMEHAFSNCSNLADLTIPNSVTRIGDYAFYDTAWYNSQPDGLVYAGKVAYKYKGTMPEDTSISLRIGTKGIADSAFADCAGLTSVTIPNSVTDIGDSAFSGCGKLPEITIPDSVTKIGARAFYKCYALADENGFVIKRNVLYYYSGSDSEVTIPDNVTAISDSTFNLCKNLVRVIIPTSVTDIGESAFSSCYNLESVTIPDSVTSIGGSAFFECWNLADIRFPNRLEKLAGGTAFARTEWENRQPEGVLYVGNFAYDYKGNWMDTTTIDIRDGTKGIADTAFSWCAKATSVNIPDSVTIIGCKAFYRSLTDVYYSGTKTQWNKIKIDTDNKELLNAGIHFQGLTKKTVTGIVQKGDGWAMRWKITYREIPDGRRFSPELKIYMDGSDSNDTNKYCWTNDKNNSPWITKSDFEKTDFVKLTVEGSSQNPIRIVASQFEGYSNLKEAVFHHVDYVEKDAFKDCTALAAVDGFDSALYYIGENAFQNCYNMTGLNVYGPYSVFTSNTFTGCKKLTLCVDEGSKAQDCADAYGIKYVIHDEIDISYRGFQAHFSPKLFSESSTKPNKELAMLAGLLSWETEHYDYSAEPADRQLYMSLGLNVENEIKNGYAYIDIQGPGRCFTVALKKITLYGIETNLLIMTARGTITATEGWSDFSTPANSSFFLETNFKVYDLISEFENTVMEGLNQFMEKHPELEKQPLKILITGHSLGGAVANLLGARFTHFADSGAWWSDLVEKEDIYVYTFGALDSIKTDGTVHKGYENIHNITNFYDYYGPEGKKVFTAAGHSRYGKFGHIDLFSKKKSELGEGKYITHEMDTYLSAVKDEDVEYEKKENQKYASWQCPVDVKIYRDGELVGQVTDNKVVDSVTTIPISVVDDEKYALLEGDGEYTFEMTGTDTGTMTYTIADASTGETQQQFENVSLEAGKTMRSAVGPETAAEIRLFVVNDKGVATAEIAPGGTETEVEPAYALGDVDGDGTVKAEDARLALRASVKLETYAEGSAKFLAADYDKNGKIESADARAILRVSVKLDPFG